MMNARILEKRFTNPYDRVRKSLTDLQDQSTTSSLFTCFMMAFQRVWRRKA